MGQPVSAELPNIRGTLGAAFNANPPSGAFYVVNEGVNRNTSVGGGQNATSWDNWINASRCSSIYKDSATTVVPESLITNFYIRY